MPSVDYDDLDFAVDAVADGYSDTQAWISRETGQVFYEFDEAMCGEGEPLPDDIDDPENYVVVPDQRELGLGKRVVMRFVAENLPRQYDEVQSIFRRRGAYSRFKDLLEQIGMLDAWYRYESEARRDVLTEWAREAGFEVVANPRPASEQPG
jgi:hypothetical protein